MNSSDDKLQYLLDIEEIKQLIYKYCLYNDGGWPEQPVSHQGPAADLFTEDAVWDGGPIGEVKGREAIRAMFASLASLPMVYHSVLNPVIAIDGDQATGHWHRIGGGIGTDGSSTLGLGGYEDEYVRTAEGWRIQRMRVLWGRRTILPGGWEVALPKVQ